MKFSIIIFPGSNCDQDCVYVLRNLLKQDVVEVFHNEEKLPQGTECVVLPGGFSYGDYLRSGAIARFSKITNSIIDFAKRGGLVFGSCNGFQILCEMGLLPGTLTKNKSLSFICDDVYLKVEAGFSARGGPTFGGKPASTRQFIHLYKPGEIIKMPIAHGEGRYVSKDIDPSQIVFQYCDKDGNITDKANPNGSILNIAGITNEKGNVLGMMPHPERACESTLGNEDGKRLFESIIAFNKSLIAC